MSKKTTVKAMPAEKPHAMAVASAVDVMGAEAAVAAMNVASAVNDKKVVPKVVRTPVQMGGPMNAPSVTMNPAPTMAAAKARVTAMRAMSNAPTTKSRETRVKAVAKSARAVNAASAQAEAATPPMSSAPRWMPPSKTLP